MMANETTSKSTKQSAAPDKADAPEKRIAPPVPIQPAKGKGGIVAMAAAAALLGLGGGVGYAFMPTGVLPSGPTSYACKAPKGAEMKCMPGAYVILQGGFVSEGR